MRLALMSCAREASVATRSISSSNVRLGSSIMAQSSPCTRSPLPPSSSAATRRGSLSSSCSPSAFASRFAGSMVTTATFAPSAAMPNATAADTVVLPTPPEPPQTQTRLPASKRETLTGSPRAALQLNLEEVSQPFEPGSIQFLSKQERQLDDPAVHAQASAQAVELNALGVAAGVFR